MILGMVKRDGVLVPMDRFQAEELELIPANVPLEVNVKDSRNIENHRRFFAFIKTAFDVQDHYTHIEHLRKALIIKAGYYDRIESHLDGRVTFHAQSLKFESMGEAKFKKVFSDCLGAFHEMLIEMGRDISESEMGQLLEFE